MLIRDVQKLRQFIAGDKTHLREVLNGPQEGLDLRYSLAHAVVQPGQASLPHFLLGSEVYIVLQGEGIMYIDEERAPVHKGQVIYIPPKAKQWIENTGSEDLVFYCIVDPAWQSEDEFVLEGTAENPAL